MIIYGIFIFLKTCIKKKRVSKYFLLSHFFFDKDIILQLYLFRNIEISCVKKEY